MVARANALAKLTRPGLRNAVPRPRLFALLDERAFEAFGAAGDVRGQALTVATLVTGCYYE